MVAVHVGTEYPCHRFSFELVLEDVLPCGLVRGVVEARIDYGPAVVIAQQPDIDVIEAPRHGHAHPVNVFSYLELCANWGRVGEHVVKRIGFALEHQAEAGQMNDKFATNTAMLATTIDAADSARPPAWP